MPFLIGVGLRRMKHDWNSISKTEKNTLNTCKNDKDDTDSLKMYMKIWNKPMEITEVLKTQNNLKTNSRGHTHTE